MALDPKTIEFMKFLNTNPAIRARIKAGPGKTLVYSGNWKMGAWREIDKLKKMGRSEITSKEILPEVLQRIPLPGSPTRTLFQYVEDVERQVPKRPDGVILWRALSGIYVANAEPPVSFAIGGDVGSDKVFVATELPVLLRNPRVMADPDMRDILEYCQRCVQAKNTEIVIPYLSS